MEKIKYFKGRYVISFYDSNDEYLECVFDNIHEICRYKNLDNSPESYNLVKIELYRALKRAGNRTTMLGKSMRVHLVDILEENNES